MTYHLRARFLHAKSDCEEAAWREAAQPAAACRAVAARLRAEERRLTLRLVDLELDAAQILALNAQLQGLQRAARLAERPESLEAALALVAPDLCAQCRALLPAKGERS
jgi:hypothetical protein